MTSEAGPSPPTTGLADDYSVVVPKKYVNMHALAALEQRVAKLGVATPGLVRYAHVDSASSASPSAVTVSPLYVTVRAAPAASQLFSGRLRELQRPLPEEEATAELTRMTRIVLNLHRYGIVHGRLTLASWREDDRNALYVVDAAFPIAALVPAAPLLKSAAPLMAPEIVAAAGGGEGATLEQPSLVPNTDVWGLAVCFLQLVLPEKQFLSMERADIAGADLMCPLINNLPPRIVSLLVRCLKSDPMARPTAEELYCELTGQPSARQAAMFAAMQNDETDDDDDDEEEEAEEEEEEDEEES